MALCCAEAMTDMHLAQLNVARPRAAMDNPRMKDFKAALDPVNRLADAAQGFVWRLTDGFGGDATTIRLAGGEIMVNLPVGDSRDALWNFAYRSPHMDYLQQRRGWFHQLVEPYQVLWWVQAGHRPTVAEAEDRLKAMRSDEAESRPPSRSGTSIPWKYSRCESSRCRACSRPPRRAPSSPAPGV